MTSRNVITHFNFVLWSDYGHWGIIKFENLKQFNRIGRIPAGIFITYQHCNASVNLTSRRHKRATKTLHLVLSNLKSSHLVTVIEEKFLKNCALFTCILAPPSEMKGCKLFKIQICNQKQEYILLSVNRSKIHGKIHAHA